jgi:hypothetical protein
MVRWGSPVQSRLSAPDSYPDMAPGHTVFTPRRQTIIGATVLYSSVFYISFALRGNSEFLLYLAEFFGFIILACLLLRYVPAFPDSLLVALSVTGLLHVMGGGIDINGVRLYDMRLLNLYQGTQLDFSILKYDQFLHALGFGIGALAFRWVLFRYAAALSRWSKDTIAVLASLGLGVLNEVSEFAAVLLFVRTGVGGYFNVSLDFTFNFLGALAAVLLVEAYALAKKAWK